MVTVTLMGLLVQANPAHPGPLSPDTWEKAKHMPKSKPRAGPCCHDPQTPLPASARGCSHGLGLSPLVPGS